jgi:3'-phosphoadenosine 5'-phosphosulfate sulfotransferase (PAPS reductase)/FAD synthetase
MIRARERLQSHFKSWWHATQDRATRDAATRDGEVFSFPVSHFSHTHIYKIARGNTTTSFGVITTDNTFTMGETKQAQKQAKDELDQKLKLASPSRQILEDLAVACAKNPSPDNTFQYAFCLSKSTERSELRYAVTILDGLVKEGYEHQVDCMYGAAVALYLLGDYDKARVSLESTI